ncbi:MAG: DNA-3-methyladenine glycosylase family protein [Halobacteriota archaeon]
METGTIPTAAVPGPFDLQATLESGQTFLWTRRDGRMYEANVPAGDAAWYRTVIDGVGVALRQTDAGLEWRAPTDPSEELRDRLGVTEAMATAIEGLPDDGLTRTAKAAFPGLRVVNEPFFPTLVSFILSAQMRVERIHALVQTLSERYGTAHRIGEEVVHAFPEPADLAAVSEAELRELGLGYRAPYVTATAEMVAEGVLTASDIRGRDYEDARDTTTGYVGVGEKVADCVLLFSLGYPDPVPLDTWIRSAIDEHYPDVRGDDYASTSRAIRDRLGPYPGVAQTYVFHYLRHRDAIEATV